MASKLRPQQGDEVVLQGAIESQIVKNNKFSNFQNLDVFINFYAHEITLYAIDMHKNMFITPFLTLWNHFENQTPIAPPFLQHLRPCHI